MTASTLATKMLCSQHIELKNFPMLFVCQNSVANGRDKALSQRNVRLWKRLPRVILASACWIGPTLTVYAVIRQKHISRSTWRGTWYGSHCTIQGYWKRQKVANNGLMWGRFQGGWMLMATLACHHTMQCWASGVCCTHSSLPWCWGQASSKSGRGGPVRSM